MSDGEKLRVGFIGVGTMGKGMVKNLLKAGFPVTIYARNPQKVHEVIEAGATLAESGSAVAAASEVVITIVPNSPEVEEVILGENGALQGAKAGTIIVDMSTINPETSKMVAAKCAEKGVHFLDAPVSGGSLGAQNGTLTIMVGGDKEVFEKCVPVFRGMGKEDAIYHIGPTGSGEVVKILNNMLGAIITAACSEALVMGVKAGIDPALIAEVVGKSSGASWQLSAAIPRNVFSGKFEPGFFTELMHKDIGLSMELGESVGVPANQAAQARKMYDAALAAGYGKDDYTAIIRPLEQAAGVEVRVPAKE